MSPSSTGRRRAGTVFVAEDLEVVVTGADHDSYFTGRFNGHLDRGNRAWDSFEGLALEEGLAWARARADRIVVRVGYETHYALGFESDSMLPWPAGESRSRRGEERRTRRGRTGRTQIRT